MNFNEEMKLIDLNLDELNFEKRKIEKSISENIEDRRNLWKKYNSEESEQ